MIDVVRNVCRERKITVLFSAHELNQLLGTLDRVLYLGNGHAALGTVDEVITGPELLVMTDTELQQRIAAELTPGWDADIPVFAADAKGMATRVAGAKVLNAIAPKLELVSVITTTSASIAPRRERRSPAPSGPAPGPPGLSRRSGTPPRRGSSRPAPAAAPRPRRT